MKVLYLLPIIFSSFLLVNCQNSKSKNATSDTERTVTIQQNCMDKVIAADEEIGKIRNHACEKISLSQTIQNYVKGLQELDYSNCPKAFSEAFQSHINAWQNMISLTDKYPNMRGEMHDLFDEIEVGENAETFKPLLKAIWDTWGEIENTMNS